MYADGQCIGEWGIGLCNLYVKVLCDDNKQTFHITAFGDETCTQHNAECDSSNRAGRCQDVGRDLSVRVYCMDDFGNVSANNHGIAEDVSKHAQTETVKVVV